MRRWRPNAIENSATWPASLGESGGLRNGNGSGIVGVEQELCGDRLARERLEERDQVFALLRAQVERNEALVLAPHEARLVAAAIVEVHDVRQSRRTAGVEVGRGVGDVAQRLGAKRPEI